MSEGDEGGTIEPQRQLTSEELDRLAELWAESRVGWEVREPREPWQPERPLVDWDGLKAHYSEPLTFDQTWVDMDGGVHERRFNRATPGSEWQETYSRDFTRFGWKIERARRWLRRLFR